MGMRTTMKWWAIALAGLAATGCSGAAGEGGDALDDAGPGAAVWDAGTGVTTEDAGAGTDADAGGDAADAGAPTTVDAGDANAPEADVTPEADATPVVVDASSPKPVPEAGPAPEACAPKTAAQVCTYTCGFAYDGCGTGLSHAVSCDVSGSDCNPNSWQTYSCNAADGAAYTLMYAQAVGSGVSWTMPPSCVFMSAPTSGIWQGYYLYCCP